MSKMVEIELEFQNNLSYIFSSLFLKGKIYLLVLAEDIALFSPKLCLYVWKRVSYDLNTCIFS